MSKRPEHLKIVCFILATILLMLGQSTIFSLWASAPDGQEDICTSAVVIFCDNFEARSLGSNDLVRLTYKSGWLLSSLSNMTVVDSSSGGVFNGNRALQFRYPASTDGIGFMEISFPTSFSDVYFRWYQKWSSNFQFSNIATKGASTHINHAPGQSMYFWWNNWRDGVISHYAQNVNREFNANVNGGQWSPAMDRWYCMEVRFKYNSGASDGVLEAWIDGVKRWDYQNVALDSPGTMMQGMLLSGYWNNSTGQGGNPAGVSHPLMYRWHDNFVVSSQRIGCLGATTPPPPPSTAPVPPSGLIIQ